GSSDSAQVAPCGKGRDQPGQSLCSRNAARGNDRIVKLREVLVRRAHVGPIQAAPVCKSTSELGGSILGGVAIADTAPSSRSSSKASTRILFRHKAGRSQPST